MIKYGLRLSFMQQNERSLYIWIENLMVAVVQSSEQQTIHMFHTHPRHSLPNGIFTSKKMCWIWTILFGMLDMLLNMWEPQAWKGKPVRNLIVEAGVRVLMKLERELSSEHAVSTSVSSAEASCFFSFGHWTTGEKLFGFLTVYSKFARHLHSKEDGCIRKILQKLLVFGHFSNYSVVFGVLF